MTPRPLKRQRVSTSEDTINSSIINSAESSEVALGGDSGGYLSGIQVYVAPHIHNRARRLRIWEKQLTSRGAVIQTDPHPEVTHVIVQPGSADAKDLPSALQNAHLVTPEWVAACLERGKRQPEEQYAVLQGSDEPPGAGDPDAHRPGEFWDEVEGRWLPLPPFGRWLGHWRHEYEGMDHLALVMRARFSNDRCEEIGNTKVMKVHLHNQTKALAEMMKYENAIDADHLEDDRGAINHRTLKYARAAAVVQACSYKVDDRLIKDDLPWVGPAITRQILQILHTGSCEQLEQMRHDEPVTTSAGEVRAGTDGGRTRAMFKRLPGVGSRMAAHWWQRGLRTFEDVEEAAGPGGIFDGHRNNSTISAEAYFSLMHREDLLETLPAVEVDEMRSAVADALEAAAGPGWRLIPVGGGARDIRSHDCDFVVTHDSNKPAEGVVNAVVDHLLERGQLWPGRGKGGDAMMRVQFGRMPGHVDRIKAHVAEKQQAKAPRFSNLAADRFDHLFGMFKTREGKARRLDLIFVPPEELGFGTLGWIGGKQFLRFMRAYSDDECGMHLNSHRLVAHKDGRVWVVPDEGPPLNRERKAEWPPGWDASRRVKHESDIFDLLGVPYHTPNERNCP